MNQTQVFAEELMVGDEIDSHDDLIHTVEQVELFDGNMVKIRVERSDGSEYTTELEGASRVTLREA
jgi:hypothetical protein